MKSRQMKIEGDTAWVWSLSERISGRARALLMDGRSEKC